MAENLKMGSALLSRFDLVFILIDKPDEEQDQRLTEHVMALHSKHLGKGVAETQIRGGSAQTLASTQGIGQLAERLAPAPGLLWSESKAHLPIHQERRKIPCRRLFSESTLPMQGVMCTQSWGMPRKRYKFSNRTGPH